MLSVRARLLLGKPATSVALCKRGLSGGGSAAFSRPASLPRTACNSVQSAHQAFSALTKDRPVFQITEPIETIHEPSAFYQCLLEGIAQARTQIVLSSLYIGSDEHELVAALDRALEANQALRVDILLDCLRGTRTDSRGQSSAALLAPLVRKYGDQRVCVAMYHTPALSGVSKRLWPQRYNETFGLQHIKAYVFDNSVIVSGANLSREYFTHRQDRYIRINNQSMAKYFTELIQAIGSFSFVINGRQQAMKAGAAALLSMPRDVPNPSREPSEFIGVANTVMTEFLRRAESENSIASGCEVDESATLAIPTVQMSQLGITQDEGHMREFFHLSDSYARLYGCRNLMASAYFNFSDFHKHNVLANSSRWDLLVASPQANGFFTASGISRYIPNMYSIIEHEFLRTARLGGRADISVEEYARDGWTFHGKGVWCYLDQQLPQLTMIGSPNYGYRSIYCDLETQITLIPGTGASQLQLQSDLHQEALSLLSHSNMVTEADLAKRIRGSPLWLYCLKPFILNKM
ncbi:CDP-diacylglycerol--glycerol-3-phosphate 3-phosphatidyltransferase [Coemansia thaxteri]|uniref:CDP-diacylglycerol--glycerol-3-phosphate 3-phosphatidyltransferase n=1 Tax=Coemansia thaxteri TaxID=2663907 RepID=A0A9W8BJB4_9FUNG|nr:CDP-diacylglycerol--glycerol-3-phosphate 3-phosphatidyltransferase [Coemansia thaxteri]KAJ2479978.1 CDP-diacylglycerol--glycerol-3-phosphate 3-phosphatidyltransferase [Coemansia sp. RSA 2320]